MAHDRRSAVSVALKVLAEELRNLRRSRWILGYALLLLVLCEALLRFGGGGASAIISLLNIVLILVPLVGLVFGTMYVYGARDFIELLLAQPVGRSSLFLGLYGGLVVPLTLAFMLGIGLPFLWGGALGGNIAGALTILLVSGALLTSAFVALAFLIALLVDDRAKGLGVAILLWLALTTLYDAVLILVLTNFSEYALEKPLLVLTLLNPVDLGRVLLLLQADKAALMGYTGAVFERFFGSAVGVLVAGLALMTWTLVPFGIGLRRFRTKDF
jgi:Cu-processing system permease protein